MKLLNKEEINRLIEEIANDPKILIYARDEENGYIYITVKKTGDYDGNFKI